MWGCTRTVSDSIYITVGTGVGGGIISCAIGKYGIATYGPSLDDKGNSIGGLKMLEYLSDNMGLSIF